MARKSMKSALSASLKAEDDAVQTRFEKADSLLKDKGDVAPEPPAAKPRVVRDSFTLPTEDYELIAGLRQRCLDLAVGVTKSEVIRAGLHALNKMPDHELMDVLAGLTKVKTGRPAGKV